MHTALAWSTAWMNNLEIPMLQWGKQLHKYLWRSSYWSAKCQFTAMMVTVAKLWICFTAVCWEHFWFLSAIELINAQVTAPASYKFHGSHVIKQLQQVLLLHKFTTNSNKKSQIREEAVTPQCCTEICTVLRKKYKSLMLCDIFSISPERVGPPTFIISIDFCTAFPRIPNSPTVFLRYRVWKLLSTKTQF